MLKGFIGSGLELGDFSGGFKEAGLCSGLDAVRKQEFCDWVSCTSYLLAGGME